MRERVRVARRLGPAPVIARLALALLALGLPGLLVACDAPVPSTPVPTGAPAPPSVQPAEPAPGSAEPAPGSAEPSPADARVRVDASLLDLLPSRIGDIERRDDPATAAEIAADRQTDVGVERVAVALYPDPATGDIAVATVVGLRPGAFGDAWFRAWRDTYNVAACEVAGGLEVGGALTTIGDHRTYIGTCVGGAHTYQVHVPAPDRLVVITAVGTGRLGERIVAGLTE